MSEAPDPRILAMSPGAEALGFAVVERGRLLYSGVRPLEPVEPHRLIVEQAVAAAEVAIEDVSPDILAVAKVMPDGSFKRSRLNLVGDRIRAVAHRKGIDHHWVSRRAATRAVTSDPEASRGQVMDALLDGYPELEQLVKSGSARLEEGAADVFEAVGLAVAAGRAAETKRREPHH